MMIVLFVFGFVIISLLGCLLLIAISRLFEYNYLAIKYSHKVSKSSINKLLINGKNNEEILQKINSNMPRLKLDFNMEKMRQILAPLGVNFKQKFYVINVTDASNMKAIIEELTLLKRLEREGVALNIIVITNACPKRAYNIKFALASLDFCLSTVRIYDILELDSMSIFMLNMLNINYYCGTKIAENITKNANYRYISADGGVYKEELHSTMQKGKGYAESKSVLCNHNIVEATTYDYSRDVLVTRLDFSEAKKGDKVEKFISLDLSNYFTISATSTTIRVVDFERQTELYFTSNKPIFLDAIYNKKGIYFRYKIDSPYIYIFRSKCELKVANIFDCESIFLRAATSLNNLPKLKVKSNDSDLDDIINSVLPEKILSFFFESPSREKSQFRAFACLNEMALDRELLSSKITPYATKYFDTLRHRYGISFGSKGIYLSKNKTELLSSRVALKRKGQTYNFDIKNEGLDDGTFRLGGVEYSGINFVSFDKMLLPISLQM